MESIPGGITIPLGVCIAFLIWLIKLAVEEALKDRRSQRETREKVALSQVMAFQAHVDECNARASTHARLEQKVDGIVSTLSDTRILLDRRSEKIDGMFSQFIEHVNSDNAWRVHIDEKFRELREA